RFYFAFHGSAAHRGLHSFPTRRSSDLAADRQPQPRALAFARQRSIDLDERVEDRPEPVPRDPAAGVLDLDADRIGRGVPRECNTDRKSTRLNSSHVKNSYAVFCWKKKK